MVQPGLASGRHIGNSHGKSDAERGGGRAVTAMADAEMRQHSRAPGAALGSARVTWAKAGSGASETMRQEAILLRIVNLHHEGALREGVEEEIFVVVEIVDAGRRRSNCRPI